MNTEEKYKEYVNTAFLKAVEPIVIDRAEGATRFDENGEAYIDCFAGISTTNAGHANEAILAAAKAQMEKVVHCCSYVYHVKAVADLAEKMAEIPPGQAQEELLRQQRRRRYRGRCPVGETVFEKERGDCADHQ